MSTKIVCYVLVNRYVSYIHDVYLLIITSQNDIYLQQIIDLIEWQNKFYFTTTRKGVFMLSCIICRQGASLQDEALPGF